MGRVFNVQRLMPLSFLVLICACVYYGIWAAKKGKVIRVRRIPGLDAIEEAVGRATELGRPVLYSFGSGELTTDNAPQTMASVDILGKTARLCARYNCKIIVVNRDGVLHSIADSLLRQVYIEQGVPERYSEDMVRFLSDQQWASAAQTMGIIRREKIAAALLFGPFYAESLLLAEAAAQENAIQVAGTTRMYQIPFFVAACDYTLLGDEMFAAQAYYSNEPTPLGSLWGEDIVKVVIMAIIVLGVVSSTLGSSWLSAILVKYNR